MKQKAQLFLFAMDFNVKLKHNFTLGSQRERRKFEKQPSHTIVSGAQAVISSPFLALYMTPLTVPFTSSRDVTVPSSNLTLQSTKKIIRISILQFLQMECERRGGLLGQSRSFFTHPLNETSIVKASSSHIRIKAFQGIR